MPHTLEQTQFARRLRRKSTIAERIMWILLRDRDLGRFKFRRQHPIGPYFADFACVAERLIVECDGITHDDRQAQDAARDFWFLQRGAGVSVGKVDGVLAPRTAPMGGA